MLNQIELHPDFAQAHLRSVHADMGIVTEAWSPLGQGTTLTNPTIREIADAHGRTPAQVILRWHIQLGNVVIPKSVTPERIASNFDVFDFELTADDMFAIASLDSPDGRLGPTRWSSADLPGSGGTRHRRRTRLPALHSRPYIPRGIYGVEVGVRNVAALRHTVGVSVLALLFERPMHPTRCFSC